MISDSPKMNHDHDHDKCTSDHSTELPCRQILTLADLEAFRESEAHHAFLGFIGDLNESIKNKTLNHPRTQSTNVMKLVSTLETLKSWTDEIKPEDVGKSRFGNPAFRTWMARLKEQAPTLVGSLTPNYKECCTYLLNSFGNERRIDYGTGHEAHFIVFLYCLVKLGVFDSNDYEALVFDVFWKYISVMRKLQFLYWLEPAGSHGVWGLDDYHFLPFLFGSGQLADHPHLRPKSIHNAEIVEEFKDGYMYFHCVHFVNSVKSASLRWHSPMLDDISGVKKWSKVNEGMFKMYNAEVLNKLPIMQHFLFGELLPFKGSGSVLGSEQHDDTHVHAFGQEHPSCCGIRVPSAMGDAVASGRIPFD